MPDVTLNLICDVIKSIFKEHTTFNFLQEALKGTMETMRAKGKRWVFLSIMFYYGLACVVRKGGRGDSQQKLLLTRVQLQSISVYTPLLWPAIGLHMFWVWYCFF